MVSKAWGMECITSHRAMPVLQARALGEQGCRSLSSVAWEGPGPQEAEPAPCLGCPGQQERAEGVLPAGLGGAWWQGSGLPGPALAAAGLAEPAGLESVLGWRALLLGGVPAAFLGSGSQRGSVSLPPQGTSPHGCWGRYLCPGGENVTRLMATCAG